MEDEKEILLLLCWFCGQRQKKTPTIEFGGNSGKENETVFFFPN